MKKEDNRYNLFKKSERPEAFTKEQNLRLLKEYRKYGDKKLRDQIVYGNLGLVLWWCSINGEKYVAAQDQINPSFEDLCQMGALVLTKAVETFDPDKNNFLFSTYVFNMLDWRIKRMLSPHVDHSVRTKESLDAPVSQDEKSKKNRDKEEMIPANMRDFDILHDRWELEYIQKQILPLLSKTERDIFIQRKILGRTLDEVGRKYSRTREGLRMLEADIDKKVRKMYLEGPTVVDKLLAGVDISVAARNRVEANEALFQKYGRQFLTDYIVPILTPVQKKVFEAFVLNYRGQDIGELVAEIGIDQGNLHYCFDAITRKISRHYVKLKAMQARGELPKPLQPTLKQQQAINRNEKYIQENGGRFFLQKYFLPTLAPMQRQIFVKGVLEYAGQSQTELAKELGISQGSFSGALKNTKDKLAMTDFGVVVDYIDGQKTYSAHAHKKIDEDVVHADLVKERAQYIEAHGGKDKLQKLFLPLLPDLQRKVFDLLYISQALSTASAVAEFLGIALPPVIIAEKVARKKLESTDLKELEKNEAAAEQYLKEQFALRVAKRKSGNEKLLLEYGGVAFLREKFIPTLLAKIDRDIFEQHIIGGMPMNKFLDFIQTERRKYSPSYVDDPGESVLVQRMRTRIGKYIIPQLEQFKASFEDFDQAVKEFYMKKGFEQIHPEDFEEIALRTDIGMDKKEIQGLFLPEELIERAGGMQAVMRDFRSRLSVTEQTVLIKYYVEKLGDYQIAEELDMTISEERTKKAQIRGKLEKYAEKVNASGKNSDEE